MIPTPDPNPSERLAEIEARVEAATEGPWRAPQGNERILTNVGEAYEAGPMRGGKRGDAEFTAHARSDIPWLLEQVREAWEFIVAHTLIEKGVVNFDLHAEAVERFRRASEQPGVVAIIRAALAGSGEAG